MDSKTSEYYSLHAMDAAELYNSTAPGGVCRYFEMTFPAGSSVLDIGCGSGRDMMFLHDMGYDVYGVDASPVMCMEAQRRFPELNGRIAVAALPADGLYFNRKFDCVLCSALLMHITDESISEAAFTIRNSIHDCGRLLLSIPVTRDDVGPGSRVPDGRLFVMRTPDYYTSLFDGVGFRRSGYYEEQDSLGRVGVSWGVMLFHLDSQS